MRLSVGLALVVSVLAVACDFGTELPNNQPCTKNDDCESKHCIASLCRAAPQFGGGNAGSGAGGGAGSAGSTASAGAAGGPSDAGAD